MKTIAFFTQKGGAGKSTLSIHVAVAAGFKHKVLLIDADPQGTVATWAEGRRNERPLVVRADPSSIVEILTAARGDGFTLAVIDCPPHAIAGTGALLKAADHIVMPAQPAMPDIAASKRSIALAIASGRPYSIVINRAPARAPEVLQAQQVLATAGVLSPIVIGDRRAFSRALTDCMAVTEFSREDEKAAIEVIQFWRWLDQHTTECHTWPQPAAA